MQNMLKKTVKCELVYTYKVNDRKMTLIFIAKTARFIVTIFRPSGGLRDHAKSTKQKMTVKIPVPPSEIGAHPFHESPIVILTPRAPLFVPCLMMLC